MPTPLLILGTHQFAAQMLDFAEATGRFEIRGFVENLDRERTRGLLEGLPVLWLEEIGALAATHQVICSLGTTRRRSLVADAEALGFQFATVVHPTAVVSPRARVGAGTMVGVGVHVGAGAEVGRHVMVYSQSLIGHGSRVGDLVNIAPAAKLAGLTTIGSGSHIGLGALVIERVRVGEGALVGSGSLVTRDVPDRVEVRGAPARIVREGIEPW